MRRLVRPFGTLPVLVCFLCQLESFADCFLLEYYGQQIHHCTQKRTFEMGVGLSIVSATTGMDSSAPQTDPTTPKKPAKAKTAKDLRQDEWRRVASDYRSRVLDPAYLGPAVRASTVEAATHYPATGGMDQECLMPGTHKHLGGAYDPTDGCIYGVPANSRAVLCLYHDVATDEYRMTTIALPQRVANCNYKWLRGIVAHGYLWAIPAWANAVLCVDIDAFWGRREREGDDYVHLIPLPPEHDATMQWQWHGAGINHEKTAIYCIPSNARHVLKVDIATKTTSLIDVNGYDAICYPNFSIETSNKWYGGIVGKDNCVYGVPYRTCAVLKIDCATDTATLVGPDYGTTKYNWHGGVQVNGKIYAHPSHANTVLVINTNPGTARSSVCTELPIVRAPYDTDPRQNYKWLGGSVGRDGNIYCPACDTSSVLKIDVTTDTCSTFGYAGTLKNKVPYAYISRAYHKESLLRTRSNVAVAVAVAVRFVSLVSFAVCVLFSFRSGKEVCWVGMDAFTAYRPLVCTFVGLQPTPQLKGKSRFSCWETCQRTRTSGKAGKWAKMVACTLYPRMATAF
jgi:hypothetical protein